MARKSDPKKKLSKAASKETALVPKGYEKFLGELKERIRTAQLRRPRSRSTENSSSSTGRSARPWSSGRRPRAGARPSSTAWAMISKRRSQGWPASRGPMSIVCGPSTWLMRRPRRLSHSLWDKLAEAGPPRAVTSIPWGHNVVLLEQVKDPEERLWYAQAAVQQGWSRSVLVHWMESALYRRQGKAQTNFERTLAPLQSDLARESAEGPLRL